MFLKYYKDDLNDKIRNSESFKLNVKIAGRTLNG